MADYFNSLSEITLSPAILVIIAIASYFMGNINPAIILGKAYGVDVRNEGSGNAGTTNALRTIGKKAGVIVFLVDVLKGVIVTLLTTLLIDLSFGMICGVMVIVGHMWPVIFKFKGGKGVATTFGVLVSVEPVLALILIAIVILTTVFTRMVSLGTCIAAIVAVPVGYLFNHWYACWIGIIALLIVIKHIPNIKRILKGEEKKLTFGNKDKKQS